MKNYLKMTSALAVVMALGACAVTPPPGSPESRALMEQKRMEAMREAADERPSWMETPERSDSAIYGTGTYMSTDLQMAISASTAFAKVQLATALGNEISGILEGDQTDIDGELMSEMNQVLKDVTVKVKLTGAEVKERKIVIEGDKYRVYVLLELPLGDANYLKKEIVKQSKRSAAAGKSKKLMDKLEELENKVDTSA